MKKVVCITLALTISGFSFAKIGGGKKLVASLDNNQVVKARKDSRKQTAFTSGRRYSGITRGHSLHLFRRRGGKAPRQESGLGI